MRLGTPIAPRGFSGDPVEMILGTVAAVLVTAVVCLAVWQWWRDHTDFRH